MGASANVIDDAIQASQVRAARGLLAWSQEQLAAASSVPKRTIARLELSEGTPQRRTLTAIRTALEAAGVEFIAENGGGAGVRLRVASEAGTSPAERTLQAAVDAGLLPKVT